MRNLTDLANSTPADYSEHAPKNPDSLAHQMLNEAQSHFPNREKADGAVGGMGITEAGHNFLYVGPGSALVLRNLLAVEQRVSGIETSKRAIHFAPEDMRSYINWTLPWETPYADKYFDVCMVNPYLKELLEEDEYTLTEKELARVSKLVMKG